VFAEFNHNASGEAFRLYRFLEEGGQALHIPGIPYSEKRVTFAKLLKIFQKQPAAVVLRWSHWFSYMGKGDDVGWTKHDAEIGVHVGSGRRWAVIHVHFRRHGGATATDVTSAHLKKDSHNDTVYPLDDAWKVKSVEEIDRSGVARPASIAD
jgi:hypothetical protein